MPAFVLAASLAFPPGAWSQKPEASREASPDYDVRLQLDDPGSPVAAALQARRGVSPVDAELPAVLAARQTGLRVVTGTFGLPKVVSRLEGALTTPSAAGPEVIARGFVAAHRDLFGVNSDEASLRLAGQFQLQGKLRVLTFQQAVDGVPVFEGQVRVIVDEQGQVVQANAGALLTGVRAEAPVLSGEQAIRAAFDSLGVDWPRQLRPAGLRAGGRRGWQHPLPGMTEILEELTIFPLSRDTAVTAYRLLIEVDGGAWYEMLIDGTTGALLYRHNLYRKASGRVWRENPMKGSRQMAEFPGPWLPTDGVVTTGNNAEAYVDRDGNNEPDSTSSASLRAGRAMSNEQVFDFPAGEGMSGRDPRLTVAASVTSLFYFVNLAHDYFYELGFNEEAGNFQTSNFGKGGKEGDSVIAEAQDGSAVNNASFGTPPDGVRPRMQMGLVTRGTVDLNDDLDLSYDGGVVFHEYAHGVSTRLVGGPDNVGCLRGTQSGALGEGWSDYFAMSFFNAPVVGAYFSQNILRGIRRFSYDNVRLTYQDLGDSGYFVHGDGEIWGATLWDLRTSLGKQTTDALVVAAMALTPCHPSFVDARDAILTADKNLNNSANTAVLWEVFARHGLGASATGRDGTSVGGTVHSAAWDRPHTGQGNANPKASGSGPELALLGTTFRYAPGVTDPDGDPLKFELIRGPAGMTVDSATGDVRWNTAFTGFPVRIGISDGKGGALTHAVQVVTETRLADNRPVGIEAMEGFSGRATLEVPEGAVGVQFRLRGEMGDPDLMILNPENGVEAGSFRFGANETLTIPAPRAGRWWASVSTYRAYSGVSLTGSVVQAPLVTDKAGRYVRTALESAVSGDAFFRVQVPAGVAGLTVSTSGGTGDADLFVRRAALPVCPLSRSVFNRCQFDRRSIGNSTDESVSFSQPEAGTYYIGLHATTAYAGVSLIVHVIEPAGAMQGSIRNSASGELIRGATISVAGTNISVVSPSGTYRISDITAGVREVTFSAPGFTPVTRTVEILADRTVTVDVTLTPVSSGAPATLRGVIRNSQNGAAIAGAVVTVQGFTIRATSQANGSYVLEGVAAGARVMSVAAAGFITSEQRITVAPGDNLTINVSLSPVLTTGELRIALNWNQNSRGVPRDLDLHLTGPNPVGGCFEVSWRDRGSLRTAPFAELEVDNVAVAGNPPTETIRIGRLSAGIYRLYVHHFSGEEGDEFAGQMQQGRPSVQVFRDAAQVFSQTLAAGNQWYWTVFTINGATGAIASVDTQSQGPPAFNCR
ncbi:MAG: hypothetical protein FJW40_20455 [Acidobacteria bacterium]|nr:hypothetical protein [Acidobacteriota bacterium]